MVNIEKAESGTSYITMTITFVTECALNQSEVEVDPLPTQLPWGAEKERGLFPDTIRIAINAKPGEFILQTLFAEFVVLSEKKIDQILELHGAVSIHNMVDQNDMKLQLFTLYEKILELQCAVGIHTLFDQILELYMKR